MKKILILALTLLLIVPGFAQKKDITLTLVEIMKSNNIDCFDITNGQLQYVKKNIRKSLSKKHLFNSPISYVENVETPALILCGELDYRCPIEQAEQYFVALKRLNKNVQFVRYPDQNHQMLDQGKPDFVIDYWTRTINFFKEYLC